MRGRYRFLLTLMLGAILAPAVRAQGREFAPGTRYLSTIPTLQQVVGHKPGERITTPGQIGQYLRALHEAAPDRTRLIRYGQTWERRDLHVLVIGSPQRMARIDTIRAGMQQLASGSPADPEALLRDLPVIVALIHGVHGNEISSAEAALQEAYHLLAAEADPVVDQIRREVVVLIDPMQNPDGRERFVLHNTLAQNLLGMEQNPDPEPQSAEHDEGWPSGRSNHYLFDLNRDWFAQTQVETQARVDLLRDWMPQVVVDLHEMGGNSTYYFPPSAPPTNPHQTPTQSNWLEKFGRATARRFDERGFEYFNREVYDSFYPGYGVSWPTAQGAIGMTFEKASARGLLWRRRDGSLLTYLDGAVEHFTAALATLATAARGREQILRDFLEFRRTAGQGATRAYLLPADQPDSGQLRRLVKILLRNGITVQQTAEPLRFDNRTLPAGSYVVPLPQPAGMLVRNLLDPQVPMNEAFRREQEERRRRRLPDRIYDITAWNLPLLFDVECIGTTAPVTVRLSAVEARDLSSAASSELPEVTFGYAVRWGPTAAALTIAALRQGYRMRFLPGDFRVDPDGPDGPQPPLSFTRGTVIFRRADNDPQLRQGLAVLAREHGATVTPLESAFVEEGISPGSNQAVVLTLPRVLLLWDNPTSSLSAGWARYVLEQRYGQPVTILRTASLARVDLRKYDAVVMPSGNYASIVNAESLRRLRDWISAGGTLITIGEATRWATAESTSLLETKAILRSESAIPSATAPSTASPPARPDAPPAPDSFDLAIQPRSEPPESIPGSLLRLLLDEDHWLSSGTDLEIQALAEGNRFFAPIRLDKGVNVGIYAGRERLLVSGILWPGSAASVARTPYLIHQPAGQGHLIAFTEDPNYRAFAEATQFLFINALLLATGF